MTTYKQKVSIRCLNWASLQVKKEKDKKHFFFVKIFIEIYSKLSEIFEVQEYVLSASLDQRIKT